MSDVMNIVCVSHLRWDFVFQRPQHLLSRAAKDGLVLYVEEPIYADGEARIEVTAHSSGVMVAVPRLPHGLSGPKHDIVQARLLRGAIDTHVGPDYVLWYYTPMALPATTGLTAAAVVYDCMDELSAFAGAPRDLRAFEDELFRTADVVFTGGQSLYEAKRSRHANIHAFASSVDVAHFARARTWSGEPDDQASLPRPRLGFFGVIDERMDYPLLSGVGPTAKVDLASLPRPANIHYLGPKSYADLPAYIAGWDVAILPFARNDATRFISPTKTPEYLAAGKPVVSTSIRDVVRPYGQQGLARIADTVDEFVAAVEAALREQPIELRMRQRIEQAIASRREPCAAQALSASSPQG
jgi:UDP-galactopyranose mutase